MGNNSTLTLANAYNFSGITYQWQSSTVSIVGPFSSITGATTNVYVVPTLTQTTYFQVVITCTNGGGINVISAVQLSVAASVTNTVPYFEGFGGINTNNQLPNCSWAASNLGSSCLTFTSGIQPSSKCAGFYQLPVGTSYFFTNGIMLNAGSTYSASLWYNTTSSLTSNWSNLSIMHGATQSTNGLSTIASVNNPVSGLSWSNLSNTFTVASTGIYYVAIRGTSTNTAATQYLYWDDLSITIPCTPLINPVTLTVTSTPNSSVLCAGQPFTLTASGAHTYLWSNGLTSPVFTYSPAASGILNVAGTNTLTGCTATSSTAFSVNPSPVVSMFATPLSICLGSSANLTAFGANTYTWSNGANGNVINVSPQVSTIYTVTGTNSFGCNGSHALAIAVVPVPSVSAVISSSTICVGETVTLSASGANTYQWIGNGILGSGSQITATPNISNTYIVIGTDANGCSNTYSLPLAVNLCQTINEFNSNAETPVFPNPTNGELDIKTGNEMAKTIKLFDVNGKLIMSLNSSKENIKVEIKDLPDGVYYLNVSSPLGNNYTKILKQ